MNKYFTNLVNAINPQIQEAQFATNSVNTCTKPHTNICQIKLLRNGTEKNVNIQGNMTHYVQRNKKSTKTCI